MIPFVGDKEFTQPLPDVQAKLSDARFLVRCVSGVESISVSEPGRAVCTLRPGFAFVRGNLELTLEVTEAVTDRSVRLLLHSKGIGTTSDVAASLSFAPQGSGTRLRWRVEITSLGGLLKAVPQGLIKASAQKVIDDTLKEVEAKLAG